MDSKNTSGGGIGIATVLFLIFLVLKLTDVISWSWWWVTSPLWISFGLWLLIFIPCAIYIAVQKHKIKKTYGEPDYFDTFRRHRW